MQAEQLFLQAPLRAKRGTLDAREQLHVHQCMCKSACTCELMINEEREQSEGKATQSALAPCMPSTGSKLLYVKKFVFLVEINYIKTNITDCIIKDFEDLTCCTLFPWHAYAAPKGSSGDLIAELADQTIDPGA
eukprot:scaffold318182_cov21-Tisochrysis_lutea.AAC.1